MTRQIIVEYWPPQEGVIDDLDILTVDIFLSQGKAYIEMKKEWRGTN